MSETPERTYAVTWRTPDGQQTTCKNLTARVAFARLWAAWKFSGEITVIDCVPEWLTDKSHVSDTWPYPVPPPACLGSMEDGWTCVTNDSTGFWCDACTLWVEENDALIS